MLFLKLFLFINEAELLILKTPPFSLQLLENEQFSILSFAAELNIAPPFGELFPSKVEFLIFKSALLFPSIEMAPPPRLESQFINEQFSIDKLTL